MTRTVGRKRDPGERNIVVALRPGAFISDRACISFVTDLQAVATEIAKVNGPEPIRAVGLYETFLTGWKYYDIALDHFERAKHCYTRAGLVAEWEKIVSLVRASHTAKWASCSDSKTRSQALDRAMRQPFSSARRRTGANDSR